MPYVLVRYIYVVTFYYLFQPPAPPRLMERLHKELLTGISSGKTDSCYKEMDLFRIMATENTDPQYKQV